MRVVFFSPHAGVWQHAYPEALVAEAVRAAGAELVYVTCDRGLSSICVTMGAHGLTSESPEVERLRVCATCRRARDLLRKDFSFAGYDFETSLDADDRARIAALIESARPDAIASFEIDGINIGRATLYEFLIERKKLQLELTDEEWRAFRPRFANAIRSFVAATRVLEREKPDRVVVYNSLYSANAMWRAVANARGVPFYFVHGGLSLKDRLQKVLVGRDSTLDWWTRIVATWPQYRDVPCSNRELSQVTDHFLQLFRGTSVFAYSAPKSATQVDVRARFGVHAAQKLVVATMSSYDEYIAAAAVGGAPDPSTLLFPTQLAWVNALIDWVRARPDLFLLLRVHPREFPNKREGLKSEHAHALEQALASLPPNVRVNWPSDQLSIYDIAEQTDVILNAWSSAGREMALLGLPVVTFCPQILQYPADLNYVGVTRETYFAAVEQALHDGWSFERTRMAYRWCVVELVRGLADISDAFDFSEERATTMLGRARNLLLALPGARPRWDLWRRPRVTNEARRLAETIMGGKETMVDPPPVPPPSEALETAALHVQVRRLVDALYADTRGTPALGTLRERLTRAISLTTTG